ncbi:BSD domain-containing protein 1-A-like [Gossypium australe]|uniref:BSD domain-containing protein 1-A-like n=1 Tax=Gossypium australe TaxID=47621 RepID=A0A5B6VLF4_9ROSI|nr:BSD domain-containing protein 1-A-like [Gossypium australe]
MFQFHLKRAQTCMKQLVDKHRTDRSFHVGDLVYLRLQPYKQQTVRRVLKQKLSLKYFGHFPVVEKVGQLPPGSRIHSTFHVSQLKKPVGVAPAQTQLLLMDVHGAIMKESVRIFERRMVKKGNQATTEILVDWVDTFPEYATWEPLQ